MNTSFSGAINEFDAYVSNTIETVEEIVDALSDSYDETALSNISKRFETIGKKYTDFTIVARDPFYDIARRSKSRLNAVKKVSQQSKSIARLFEKYSKNPKSYSAVQSRLQINTLIAELGNLRTTLSTSEVEPDANLSAPESTVSHNRNETVEATAKQVSNIPPNQTSTQRKSTSEYKSSLEETSKRLNIDISTSDLVNRSRLFYEALLTIQRELYQRLLSDLTKNDLSILEADIRTIINGINDLQRYTEIENVRQYLQNGYSDIAVALRIIDDISIEPDGASRVKRSIDSIMNFSQELDKAILSWPRELIQEYSTNIDAQGQGTTRAVASAQANIEASSSSVSEPTPGQPTTQEGQVQTSSVDSTVSESSQVFVTPSIQEEIPSALSPSAQRAIGIAENLRRQIENPDSRYLFTEYLLIGLNELPEEAPNALLAAFGLDRLRLVRGLAEIRKWQIPSDLSYREADISEKELASLPYSANTIKVLEVALRIHQEKAASAIQPRHLLAALLEVENAVAYSWMVEMGVPTTLVRETLKRIPEKQKITPAMFAFAPGVASADLTAEKDSLGFEPYAQALAEIIIKKETVPPVVFGIYGPWGSGKSTFMSFVKKHLENWDTEQQRRKNKSSFFLSRLFRRQADGDEVNQASQDIPRILCVSFDAWAYTDANKLWVGLIQTISQKLDEQITWWRRPIYWLTRTGWQFVGAVLLSLLPMVVGIAIALAQPLWNSAQNFEFVRYVIGLFGFLGSLKLVDNQKPLSDIVRAELNKLDRTEIEGVINRIQKHIHATVEKYFKLSEEEPVTQESAQGEVRRQKKLKLVVFIDELDRCPLEKIVDILESIKLFLAEDIFIVLMAVDTRVAAEAIRLHYKEVENPELAHEYLEKIIQVPIPVPVAKKGNLKTYMDSMMSVKKKEKGISKDVDSAPHSIPISTSGTDLILTRAPLPVTPEPFKPFNLEDTAEEQQTIIDFGEKHLAGNPRRMKRLLNTYRYVKILATRQGIRTDRADWQINMILWLGATMSWPVFMEEAIKQARSQTSIESTFWENVAKGIPEDLHPPSDSFTLFPSKVEDLQSLASLADNFIKENPPRPKRKEKD